VIVGDCLLKARRGRIGTDGMLEGAELWEDVDCGRRTKEEGWLRVGRTS
jgi:hypothetical protein